MLVFVGGKNVGIVIDVCRGLNVCDCVVFVYEPRTKNYDPGY